MGTWRGTLWGTSWRRRPGSRCAGIPTRCGRPTCLRRRRTGPALGAITGYAELAPDLVVEVVSPSDRAGEVTSKAVAWLDAGVRLVWVVGPQARLATVHRPDGVLTLVRGADAVLDGGDVLPGLQVRLADVLGEQAAGSPEG